MSRSPRQAIDNGRIEWVRESAPGMIAKTLFLHIGSPKTGSTALQKFFALNEKRLMEKGICYPKYRRHEFIHNHLYFSNLVVKAGGKRHQPQSERNRRQAKRRIAAYLDKVVRESGSCHSILISGEEMFYARDLSVFEGIRELFPSIKIMVYLRRQDQFLQSYYLQHYKTGKIRESIQTHEYLKDDFWLDYHARLASWARIFDEKNIIVRPFERIQFHQGNLFSDFLFSAFGFALTKDFELPARDSSNLRVDGAVYETIKLINSFDLPRRQTRPIIKRLLDYPVPAEERNRPVALLSPSECRDLVARFEPHNRKIAEAYLPSSEGSLFLSPGPDPEAPWHPGAGICAEKVARILLWVLIGLEQRMNWRWRVKRALQKLADLGSRFGRH